MSDTLKGSSRGFDSIEDVRKMAIEWYSGLIDETLKNRELMLTDLATCYLLRRDHSHSWFKASWEPPLPGYRLRLKVARS